MDTLVSDIRYGIRQLVRRRGSSLIAILTLALGIGASTALFSVIDATMLHPLPYPDPEQLVTVSPQETMPNGRVSRATASMEDMRNWQKSDDVFAFVAGSGSAFRGRIVDEAEPARLSVSYFTEDYLPMHGVEPRFGRNFTRADTEPGAPLVALLGDGYWHSHFGGREDVIGQTLRFDTETATIIGVLPPSFNATTPVSMPLQVPLAEYSRRGTGRVSVYARLRPGITIDQARERLTARMQPTTLPDGTKGTNPTVTIRSRLDGALAQSRTTVNVLTGAVALILLIACVNVAGLLLARGATRQSELAVRASLGAGRGRLIRQLLTESVVLAIPGGALGLLLAWLSLDAIVANIPLSISSDAPVTLNLNVLVATVVLLLPTAVLFGLAPALKLSRVHLGAVLARGGRQRSSALSRRGGQWLIGAEVALAVVLVAGAGLMIRSFVKINEVDLGFNPRGLTVMETMPLDQSPAVHNQFYRGVLQQVRAIPGVASAGIVDNFALGGVTTMTEITPLGAKGGGATVFRATPGYFAAIGATLKSGRFPTESEFESGAPVVVVSANAEDTLFEGHAVGREFQRLGSDRTAWSVVGVIADLKHGGPLVTRTEPQVFFPLTISQYDLNTAMQVIIRPSARIPGLPDRLRKIADGVGPRVLVERIRSSEAVFGDRVVTPRRRTVLLGLLGGLGLVLALVGVFGMTAYSVSRRTVEIGVRMAFGARPSQVVRTILRDAAIPVVLGTAIGAGLALLTSRAIASFLFNTAPTDAATLIVVSATLAAAATVAALVPALRAARVDPASSLRAD